MKKLTTTTLFLLIAFTCFAQRERWQQHEVGFTISISFINEKLSEGTYYQPVLLKGLYGWHMGKTANIDNRNGHFIGYLEPQINPVFVSGQLIDLEFGCNFGIRYEHQINMANKLYAAIGTGPHYTTIDTKKQHRGYLFSDNFIAGWYHQLHGPIYSNVQYHFRHISNANLMKPNQGIDNHFVTLGVSRFIE
ncbi:MAG: acyloxyacyl hydrolase [Bacteroidetes bacterium]|nr:acyloxyacyl hydrolase [Bacteroidota bacterium]